MSEDGQQPAPRGGERFDVSGQEWGSDVVADVLKAYGFPFVSYNPGASFRGIEESLVNYNDNVPPTIEVTNEGLAVAIAHGYAKATGEPAACLLHDTVGTLNGSMSIFNAYVDGAPVVMLSGNGPLRKRHRRPWIDWVHSNLDQGSLVRDFVKWFDQPTHTDGVVESIARAVRIAATPPCGPTYVTVDHGLQENRLDAPHSLSDLSKYERPSAMAPHPDAIDEAASRLVAADAPVVLVDQVGDSREAVSSLVELAELLGAPVVDSKLKARYNFPNTHPLYVESLEPFSDTDLLLALDVWSVDFFTTSVDGMTREEQSIVDGDPQLIDVGYHDLGASSLVADYYDLQEVDVPIMADTAVAIPALVEAVRETMGAADRRRAQARRESIAAIHDEQRADWERATAEVWEEEPISVPRLAGELWELIQDESWVLVNGTLGGWPHRLWEIDEFDRYVGGSSGGAGVGYGIGAAIGGALAYADTGRIPINLQADGDLLQFPAGLWTMARHDVPVLTVVHNNGTLYNSTKHRIDLADFRGRDASFERALIGTGLNDPTPDYAGLAEAFGVAGFGPVEEPDELAPALERAWGVVAAGEPALVDVVAQPR